MAFDLTEPLVIGISSRALFNLEEENKIFEKQGLRAYEEYQVAHEKDILQPGTALALVKAFLGLNKLRDKRLVEVIVMSRNSPNTSLRIFNSAQHYGLDITRAALTGGVSIVPYLKAFKTDLFLSANDQDVKLAIDNDVAAGVILTEGSHAAPGTTEKQIRIAFDGDAVLFSSESERVYKHQGLEAFVANEVYLADVPLQRGPFANFLTTLSHIQEQFKERSDCPIRTALVTSRSVPCHERAIKTLRQWGVHVDEAYFLGGVEKKEILQAFGADIFFDDQDIHTVPASQVVAAARVPYKDGEDPGR